MMKKSNFTLWAYYWFRVKKLSFYPIAQILGVTVEDFLLPLRIPT